MNVRDPWAQLPAFVKGVVTFFGGMFTTGLFVAGILNLPGRATELEGQVQALQVTTRQLDARIASQSARIDEVLAEFRTDRAYMLCLTEYLAGLEGRTLLTCGNARNRQ